MWWRPTRQAEIPTKIRSLHLHYPEVSAETLKQPEEAREILAGE
jgi:hypothetical protein